MDSSVVSLKNRQEVDATMAFHLEKPSGLHFKAGQAVDVTLSDPKEIDPEGNSRAFSIVSRLMRTIWSLPLECVTHPSNDDSDGKLHLPILQGPIYYIAGPSAMVTGMRHVLIGAGVDEDDIRTEEFAGY